MTDQRLDTKQVAESDCCDCDECEPGCCDACVPTCCDCCDDETVAE